MTVCLIILREWRKKNGRAIQKNLLLMAEINLLKPKTYCMNRQFDIQNFCVLPPVHLCVLYGSENKQRLYPYTALTDWFL